MKLGHEYFKFYLHQLPDYNSKKCHETCVKDQTPKANLPYTAKVLFTTQEGIKAVLQFLKKTKVRTRKWLLKELKDEEVEEV